MVKAARHLLQAIHGVTRALVSLASSAMRSRAQLAAENLFLRKQLALYRERKVKPRRADDATRIILRSSANAELVGSNAQVARERGPAPDIEEHHYVSYEEHV
jgi:hypothetical protein